MSLKEDALRAGFAEYQIETKIAAAVDELQEQVKQLGYRHRDHIHDLGSGGATGLSFIREMAPPKNASQYGDHLSPAARAEMTYDQAKMDRETIKQVLRVFQRYPNGLYGGILHSHIIAAMTRVLEYADGWQKIADEKDILQRRVKELEAESEGGKVPPVFAERIAGLERSVSDIAALNDHHAELLDTANKRIKELELENKRLRGGDDPCTSPAGKVPAPSDLSKHDMKIVQAMLRYCRNHYGFTSMRIPHRDIADALSSVLDRVDTLSKKCDELTVDNANKIVALAEADEASKRQISQTEKVQQRVRELNAEAARLKERLDSLSKQYTFERLARQVDLDVLARLTTQANDDTTSVVCVMRDDMKAVLAVVTPKESGQ